MFPDSILPLLSGAVIGFGLLVCFTMAFLRFLLGPTQHDRLAAIESITILLIGFFALTTLMQSALWYFDVILVLSLVGFLSTVAYSKFLEKGDIRDD